MPDYIIRQRDRGQAEAKCLKPRPKFWPRARPLWPRGLNITGSAQLNLKPSSLSFWLY